MFFLQLALSVLSLGAEAMYPNPYGVYPYNNNNPMYAGQSFNPPVYQAPDHFANPNSNQYPGMGFNPTVYQDPWQQQQQSQSASGGYPSGQQYSQTIQGSGYGQGYYGQGGSQQQQQQYGASSYSAPTPPMYGHHQHQGGRVSVIDDRYVKPMPSRLLMKENRNTYASDNFEVMDENNNLAFRQIAIKT